VIPAIGEASPLVIARGTYGAAGDAQRIDQFILSARMADSDRPRFALWIAAPELELAARIDGKIPERLKLTRGEIDRQALGDRPQVQDQRPKQRNRSVVGVNANIPITDRSAGIESAFDFSATAMLSIEAARFHGVADGWVEGACALLSHRQRKSRCFEEDRAHSNGNAHLSRELHHLAFGLESRATFFDPSEPIKCTLDGFLARRGLSSAPLVTDDVDRHDGAHQS